MKNFRLDKAFLIRVLAISVPIILQQLLLSMAGFVDSVMVGSIFRGVASTGIATQYASIMWTVFFGINSGVGLFIAQYYGAKDEEGMRRSFALMILINLAMALVFTFGAFLFPRTIIGFYTSDSVALELAVTYLVIIAFGFVFNSISFAYSVAYRNIQRTVVPLIISLLSQGVNVLFNWLLIYGIGPFPELGVAGAAIATTLSAIVSAVGFWTYAKLHHEPFLPRWRHFKQALSKNFIFLPLKKTSTLVINELFFGVGMTLYVKIMNDVSTNAFEGYRMAEIIAGFMLVVTVGLSTAVGSLIGEQLGKQDFAKAKDYSNQFFVIGIGLGLLLALVNAGLAQPLVALFQNSIAEVNQIGVAVTYVFSIRIFLRVFISILFALFRSGGDVQFVMIIDAGLLWLLGLPLAWIGYHWLGINDIVQLFLLIQIEPLVRVFIGFIHYRHDHWVKNLTI